MTKLFPIMLVNFIGTMGFSIVLPFLVFLVDRFGGSPVMFGLLAAVYPVFQLVGAPLLGRMSDTHGRREVLLVSQAGTLASWVIFAIAFFLPVSPLFSIMSGMGMIVLTLPLLVLFIARGLDGLTGGNISVANAYVADISSKKNRNRNFGKMSISANLGFIIGPALAGLLGATAYRELLPVMAAILISVVATLIIAFRLPESMPCVLRKNPDTSLRTVFSHSSCIGRRARGPGMRAILKMPHIPYLLLLYFLIFLGFNIFYTAFPVHALKGLSWSIADLGIFFSVLSLFMVGVQGPLLSRLSGKLHESTLIVAGSVLLATNFIALTNPALIYAAAVLFALGNGLMWPSFLSLLSKKAGSSQGAVQGLGSSVGSLASIIGLVGGGVLYMTLGAGTFIVSAAIIFLVVLLSFRMLAWSA